MTNSNRAAGLLALSLLTVGSLSGAARADDVVYNQPAVFPGSANFDSWTSSFDPSFYGDIYTTYDNFSLAAPAAITNVTWQGFSFDNTTLGSTNTPVESFNIDFYADTAGKPGALLYVSNESFTETVAGTNDFFGTGSTETFYNYAATLTTPFAATAGTEYWIAIQGVTDYPAMWSWTAGTGGDGHSYQTEDPIYGSEAQYQPGDRAFSLGAATPLPQTAVAGAALLAAVGLTRAQRRLQQA